MGKAMWLVLWLIGLVIAGAWIVFGERGLVAAAGAFCLGCFAWLVSGAVRAARLEGWVQVYAVLTCAGFGLVLVWFVLDIFVRL